MACEASTDRHRVRQAELARLLGVSRQSINELIGRGVIQPEEDGLIDVAAARAGIVANLHPTSKTLNAVVPTPTDAPASGASALPGDAPMGDSATSYHVAKTLRETAEAHIASLKLAEMRGELIRVEAVRQVMATIFATCREAVLQLPARMAPLLAAESDPAAVQTMLHSSLHDCLDALANAPVSIEQIPSKD